MPVSFQEYYFYALCLKAKLSVIAIRQDTRQDIGGKKIKNFDFIINTKNKVYLIDIKGSSILNGDVKVSQADIDGLKILKGMYGSKVIPLFVFFWTDAKLKLDDIKRGTISSKFRIKAIKLEYFKGKNYKSWNVLRLTKKAKENLKDIWEIIPEFKNIFNVNSKTDTSKSEKTLRK